MSRKMMVACICASALTSAIIGCISTSNKSSSQYDQLVNNSLNISKSVVDPAKPTEKSLEKFFKQPIFMTWFTNDTFYVKDLEIGQVERNVFCSDNYTPELSLETMSVSNNAMIAIPAPKITTFEPALSCSYVAFLYRGARYAIIVSGRGHIKYGNWSKKNPYHIDPFENAVLQSTSSKTIYTDSWKIGPDEHLKIFKDDGDQIFVQFIKK